MLAKGAMKTSSASFVNGISAAVHGRRPEYSRVGFVSECREMCRSEGSLAEKSTKHAKGDD